MPGVILSASSSIPRPHDAAFEPDLTTWGVPLDMLYPRLWLRAVMPVNGKVDETAGSGWS